MNISIDDRILEPDVFLLKVLNAKCDWMSRRIDELLVSKSNKLELERLIAARAEFLEVIRSPRLFLARPAGAPAQPTVSSAPRPTGLPFGAVPQPRRVNASGMSITSGSSSAPTTVAPTTPSPTADAPATGTAKKGGMLSFLKNVQTTAKDSSGPDATSGAGSTRGAATPGSMSASPSSSPASPAPAAPTPVSRPVQPASSAAGSASPTGTSAPVAKSKGQMLSFLETMRTASTDSSGDGSSSPEPRVKELTYEGKKALIEMLKVKASSTGFHDVYELLNFKLEKLQEHRAKLLRGSTLPGNQVTALIDREIAEIKSLLMKNPQEILPQMQEFDEIASVDKGGLAAIRHELKGLLDEIK